MRNHAETCIIRNRTYTLAETYKHIDVAQKVADMYRKGGNALAYVVKARGCNAVYVHNF